MDLKTYQAEAFKTAMPTALNTDYLVPALIAEVGECWGKVAKAVRDEWNETRLADELVKEWGDCAWPTAVLLNLDGEHKTGHVTMYPKTRMDALEEIHGFAECLPQDSQRTEWRTDLLHDIWAILRDGSEIVTGQPFDAVLEANLAKLADRANRGKIGGSGDAR